MFSQCLSGEGTALFRWVFKSRRDTGGIQQKSNVKTARMVSVPATKQRQNCQLREDRRDILKDLCNWKGGEMIEDPMMP